MSLAMSKRGWDTTWASLAADETFIKVVVVRQQDYRQWSPSSRAGSRVIRNLPRLT